MDECQFSYLGQEDTEEQNYDQPGEENIRHGRRYRGKDLDWRLKTTFENVDDYKNSNIFQDLNENFTLRKRMELNHGDVENYICRFSRRVGFSKCFREIRVIFPSDTIEVQIQEYQNHVHEESSIKSSKVYRWSALANKIIETGIKNGAMPKVILRNLRDQDAFGQGEEPSLNCLYNKVASMKKILKLSEKIENTHQLRIKIKDYEEIPDDKDEGFVSYSKIDDDVTDPENTRLLVIFTTRNLIERMSKSDNIHVDATYRLCWQKYPILICGVTSDTGTFYGSMVILSSHEDAETWSEVYKYVHDLNIHPKFRMSDGAKAITRGATEVFTDCEECKDSVRLMCWSHTYRYNSTLTYVRDRRRLRLLKVKVPIFSSLKFNFFSDCITTKLEISS